MSGLLTSLLQKSIKSPTFVKKVAQKLGVSEGLVSKGMSVALPFILGGIAKNAKKKEGASLLSKALDKKHDGSILDRFQDLVDRPEKGEGAGILKHVLGSKQGLLEQVMVSQAQLDEGQSKQLTQILSPMVMGALGKEQKEGHLDASGLVAEIEAAAEQTKEEAPIENSLVHRFLDKDGDGDLKDDLLSMGMSFLR